MCKIHVFFCKLGFVAIYALLSQICFVAIYALLCGEKINKTICDIYNILEVAATYKGLIKAGPRGEPAEGCCLLALSLLHKKMIIVRTGLRPM